MLRYVEQLGELYWWKYSRLIIMTTMVFLICFAIVAVEIMLNWDKVRFDKLLKGS